MRKQKGFIMFDASGFEFLTYKPTKNTPSGAFENQKFGAGTETLTLDLFHGKEAL